MLFAAIVLAMSVSRANAHPFGPSSGAQIKAATLNYSEWQTVDGLFARMTTPGPMDVPLTGGQPSKYPGNNTVIGINARPLQIVATWDADARDAGEHVSMGILAGCNHHERDGKDVCTGVHSNGGVYKRVYVEDRVVRWLGDVRKFDIDFYDPLSNGDDWPYQMQRKASSGGGFEMRYFFNASQKRVTPLHHFNYGSAVVAGAESATCATWTGSLADCSPGGFDCCGGDHQELNMVINDVSNIYFHSFGDPSVSLPGLTNMRSLANVSYNQPHWQCTFTDTGGLRFAIDNGERC